jgi:hypothetical protein
VFSFVSIKRAALWCWHMLAARREALVRASAQKALLPRRRDHCVCCMALGPVDAASVTDAMLHLCSLTWREWRTWALKPPSAQHWEILLLRLLRYMPCPS